MDSSSIVDDYYTPPFFFRDGGVFDINNKQIPDVEYRAGCSVKIKTNKGKLILINFVKPNGKIEQQSIPKEICCPMDAFLI